MVCTQFCRSRSKQVCSLPIHAVLFFSLHDALSRPPRPRALRASPRLASRRAAPRLPLDRNGVDIKVGGNRRRAVCDGERGHGEAARRRGRRGPLRHAMRGAAGAALALHSDTRALQFQVSAPVLIGMAARCKKGGAQRPRIRARGWRGGAGWTRATNAIPRAPTPDLHGHRA